MCFNMSGKSRNFIYYGNSALGLRQNLLTLHTVRSCVHSVEKKQCNAKREQTADHVVLIQFCVCLLDLCRILKFCQSKTRML